MNLDKSIRDRSIRKRIKLGQEQKSNEILGASTHWIHRIKMLLCVVWFFFHYSFIISLHLASSAVRLHIGSFFLCLFFFLKEMGRVLVLERSLFCVNLFSFFFEKVSIRTKNAMKMVWFLKKYKKMSFPCRWEITELLPSFRTRPVCFFFYK